MHGPPRARTNRNLPLRQSGRTPRSSKKSLPPNPRREMFTPLHQRLTPQQFEAFHSQPHNREPHIKVTRRKRPHLIPLVPTANTEFAKVPEQKLEYITREEIRHMIDKAVAAVQEPKYLLASGTNAFGSVTYTYSSLTDVPQGNTDVTRIGDFIQPRHIHLTINIVRNPATANVGEVLRIVVFQFLPQFSLQPPTSNVLWKNDPSTGNITPFSEWIKDASSSIRILYDSIHHPRVNVMTGLTATTEGYKELSFHVSLDRAIKHIQYVNGSTTDATNKIFIGTCSNTNTTPPSLTWRSQFTFWDA